MTDEPDLERADMHIHPTGSKLWIGRSAVPVAAEVFVSALATAVAVTPRSKLDNFCCTA
jgi:hypothetical protein